MKADLRTDDIKPIESENWWKKLDSKEQETIHSVDDRIGPVIDQYRKNRTAIGKLLYEAYPIMKPKGLWLDFIWRRFPGISRNTGLRIWHEYEETVEMVPEPIIDQGLKMGVDFSEREMREAVKRFPPPKRKVTPKKAAMWISKVVEMPRQKREPVPRATVASEEDVLQEAYTRTRRALVKIPEDRRLQVALRHCGMILKFAGATKAQLVKLIAVPAEWNPPLGRPKTKAA
jgi:hypothetical protein